MFYALLFVPFGLALLLVLVALIGAAKKIEDDSSRSGGLSGNQKFSWKLNEKWGANLTVFGALAAAVLAASLLPAGEDSEYLSGQPNSTYAVVAALFAFLILSSPLAFQVVSASDRIAKKWRWQIVLFAASSIALLWGVLGQIFVIALVVAELYQRGLPWPLALLLGGALLTSAIAVLMFAHIALSEQFRAEG
ncbi:hypothetical protein [Kineococcus terrestris]|uniref:hypothetical protein n=1 Tax=Kineococcus terrestris TaxID=2044856 RepID=UPI0034DB568B